MLIYLVAPCYPRRIFDPLIYQNSTSFGKFTTTYLRIYPDCNPSSQAMLLGLPIAVCQ